MCCDAPHFIILLGLTPDDSTRQGESAATIVNRIRLGNWMQTYNRPHYLSFCQGRRSEGRAQGGNVDVRAITN
jgi:hypothetical protein